jgi:glyoxylase-like metal-dependent hydrolase (beta-lactamase superfamily II)
MMPNTFQIGDIEVIAFSDGTARVPGTMYFAGTTKEQWDKHSRWQDHEGNVEFQFASFVIRTGGQQVLIDTGLGNVQLGPMKGGALLGEMAAAGVKPEDIDLVFLTHLHFDHAGACAKDGQPVFPKATYRWSSQENEYWAGGGNPNDPTQSLFSQKDMIAAIGPNFEAADDGAAIAPGVNVIATPGHTPGHAGVVISSGTERAFILGDAIACPVQLEETEWSGLGDIDPNLARQTQEAVAREIEDSGALMTTAHFPGLTFGRVLRGEGKRYWAPV